MHFTLPSVLSQIWTHPGKRPATAAMTILVLVLPLTYMSPPALAQALDTSSEKPALASVIKQLPSAMTDSDFLEPGEHDEARVELGRRLFFDPILSGNQNISCGTCHDPATGTSDAVALSIGEGGRGQGRRRQADQGVTGRVPRNAQALYNLGALEYRSFFHDGRLDANSTHVHGAGFKLLDGERLPEQPLGLLARQAFFPVVSAVEMAGQPGENPVADAVARYQLAGIGGAWDLITARLRVLPDYIERFQESFKDVNDPDDIQYTHVAEALAVFQARAFRSTHSRFDDLLDSRSVEDWTASEQQGLVLFYGKAGCSRCHSGQLLTDHDFHAIAMPQIGPGKGHGHDSSYQRLSGLADRLEDEGRSRISRDPDDRFRFRTPSLRNVALSGPWGHAGTYPSLEEVIQHHLDPLTSLHGYRREHAERTLPALSNLLDTTGRGFSRVYHPLDPTRVPAYNLRRGFVQGSESLRSRIAQHNDLRPVALRDDEVTALVAFLHTLTDPRSTDQSDLIPLELPSGLEPQPAPAHGAL